jgi:hypothetical protein
VLLSWAFDADFGGESSNWATVNRCVVTQSESAQDAGPAWLSWMLVTLVTPLPIKACFDVFCLEWNYVAQCESIVFFPDNPAHAPQFGDCPRPSETKRRTWRFGDRSKGEPMVVNFVVKLCVECAKVWDAAAIEESVQGGR